MRLQLDLQPLFVQFAGTKVNLKDTKSQDAAGSGSSAHGDTPPSTSLSACSMEYQ
jgi:hypothetical protein